MIISSHSITIFYSWAPGLREGGCLFVRREEHVFLVTSPHVIILSTMYWQIIIYVLHGKAWGHGPRSYNLHIAIVPYTHTHTHIIQGRFRLMFCFLLQKINMNRHPLLVRLNSGVFLLFYSGMLFPIRPSVVKFVSGSNWALFQSTDTATHSHPDTHPTKSLMSLPLKLPPSSSFQFFLLW